MQTLITLLRNSAATVATVALVAVSSGAAFGEAAIAHADAAPITVTIDKFVDGSMATAASADNSAFPMTESYTIGGTPGVSAYTLSPTGINSDNAYEAVTSPLDASSTYTTSEDTTGPVVAPDCSTGDPYALAGYTTGATFADAEAATPSMTPPTFTNLASDEFVIVWNTTCPLATAANPTTNAATGITASDATLNGTNGNTDATDSSFWVSTSTFSTASPTLPAGVYSTADLGPVASSTAFSALLSSATGMPAVTASTTYYYAAWTETSGTWAPGDILNFTTSATDTPPSGTITGTVGQGTLAVTSITPVQTNATADGTYADGWSYLFDITVPSNQPNLAMKFADWFDASASSTMPVANNMQISSAQAASTAPVTITAADTYSSPALDMTGDLSTSTPGMQVQVLVQVAVPLNTVNGSYTTTYGVQTLP
jgi:hypothetical protein